MVVSSAVELIFKETAMFTSLHAKAVAKANRASHGPRVLAKERAKQVRVVENPKENPDVSKVPQARTRVKTSKTGSPVLENPEIRDKFWHPADKSYTDTSWFDDGWSFDEWMPGARLAGMMVGKKPVKARFHWEVLILVP